ncbi:hypothetical protein B0I37DRAFT_57345 [Chaetomium sp. MPI-CAGE-AT-0009]|nr:hypothetical protein B0I37DRAFT_57345 [Chaetomium sp. MPI-CAGE-AT-0009]
MTRNKSSGIPTASPIYLWKWGDGAALEISSPPVEASHRPAPAHSTNAIPNNDATDDFPPAYWQARSAPTAKKNWGAQSLACRSDSIRSRGTSPCSSPATEMTIAAPIHPHRPQPRKAPAPQCRPRNSPANCRAHPAGRVTIREARNPRRKHRPTCRPAVYKVFVTCPEVYPGVPASPVLRGSSIGKILKNQAPTPPNHGHCIGLRPYGH